jgi:predicted DCC family thiol-disulfide oxidoreductase YuxK
MEGTGGPDMVFFDGDCALCQKSVIFLLERDADGSRFRFGSQSGRAFQESVPQARRPGAEGSLVILTPDGEVLLRSTAVVRVLRRLGGHWGVAGTALWLVPRPLRELAYRVVAKLRKRLFRAPSSCACGLLPASLRGRFLPGA